MRRYGSRRAHAVPRPEPILAQEVQWDQEMFWTTTQEIHAHPGSNVTA
jgi:hypothetical protein